MIFHSRLFAFFSVALVLFTAAGEATAITISRVRGAALLGRPLDLTAQIQYAADEDPNDSCYGAQVQFGELVLPPELVKVSAEPGSQGKVVQLRITTKNVLDEPTLALKLSVGCLQKVSRTFHLLADVLTEPLAVQPAVGSPSAVLPQAAAMSVLPGEGAGTPLTGKPEPLPPSNTKVKREKKNRSTESAASVAQAEVPRAPKKASGGAGSGSGGRVEFQIEELEKRLDSVLQRKIEETQLSTAQHETKLKSLDAELQGLKLLTAKNQKNLELLAQTLEKSSSSEKLNTLVYVLAGAVLLLIAGGAYFAWSTQRAGATRNRWWNTSDESTDLLVSTQARSASRVSEPGSPDAPGTPKPNPPVEPSNTSASAPNGSEMEDIDLAIDLDALESQAIATKSAPLAEPVEQPARTEKRDFAHSTASAMRAINTKEMLDIRQQAEFFMALGQHDEAINLLQHNINDNEQTNPLVYLDLLKVLNTLGRKQDYDRYAAEFNQQFTGVVPEFTDFDRQGDGLDAYADICAQIVQLWPSDDTIVFIENCLVRTQEDDPDTGFELEAFRDLLMLHGVLRRLDSMATSSMAPFSATRNPHSELGALPVNASNFAASSPASMATLPVGPIPDLASMHGQDHEHLNFSEMLPSAQEQAAADAPALNELDLNLDIPDVPAPAPAPAIAPSAYTDLLLGGKTDNLIDFDISGIDKLAEKPKKN